MSRRRRRGVALLTVLLLVLVMSGVAVVLLDEVRFALRRSANGREVAQARWYAIGAEALARARISQLYALDANRTTLAGDWEGNRFSFPIEGGIIEAMVYDAGNCFNINSLVSGGAGEEGADQDEDEEETEEIEEAQFAAPPPTGPPPGSDPEADAARAAALKSLSAAQFAALLRVLGAPSGKVDPIVAGAIDWIDRDQEARPGGGEDDRYARAKRPYRTADTLMVERSELRALQSLDAETYDRIRPFVCALPTARFSPINVNTLAPEDAPLLVMLTDGAISLSQARQVIAQRPEGGWRTLVEFWQQPSLERSGPGELTQQVTSLKTTYFGLELRVVYGRADVAMSALFQADRQGRARLMARRWTTEE